MRGFDWSARSCIHKEMFSTLAPKRNRSAVLAASIRDVWTADSLRGRFARGSFWSLMGAAIAQSSNLAASVIVARLLGREDFGKFGMIQSTIGMLGIFA